MTNLGIASVGAIVVISYLVGMGVKVIDFIPDKIIPVICGVVGAGLGVIGLYFMPDFPASDILSAIAVGIVSGLSATGINQIGKQLIFNNDAKLSDALDELSNGKGEE